MKKRQAKKSARKWHRKLADLGSYICKPTYQRIGEKAMRLMEKQRTKERAKARWSDK